MSYSLLKSRLCWIAALLLSYHKKHVKKSHINKSSLTIQHTDVIMRVCLNKIEKLEYAFFGRCHIRLLMGGAAEYQPAFSVPVSPVVFTTKLYDRADMMCERSYNNNSRGALVPLVFHKVLN